MALHNAEETERLRRSVLTAFGASGGDLDQLLAYNANVFKYSDRGEMPSFPLSDEPFVSAWERYVADAAVRGAVAVLRRPLVQLEFPIRSGIGDEPEYRSVVRRGTSPDRYPLATGLEFSKPDQIRVFLQETAAGRIGVVSIGDREDFERFIRAVTARNEPVPVPPSMGATMISGFNNWDRIHEYRRAWTAARGAGDHAGAWEDEFQRLVPQRERYQDRFILVSEGAYSGVSATLLGLSPAQWLTTSLAIRIEHECTHYFTKRVLGVMRNNLIDEIIADYMGMVAATGRFHADWFGCFMGLEGSGRTPLEGRIGIYRGDPPLSDGAFRILQSLVRAAAKHLEKFDGSQDDSRHTVAARGRLILAMTRMTLEELACDEAMDRLQSHLTGLRSN